MNKKLRSQKRLSQDQLARLADIPYNTLVNPVRDKE